MRFLSVLACVAMLTACQPDTSVEKPITIALSSAPKQFDPRFATDATSTRLNQLVYQGIVQFDESNQPVPDLMSWVELSPVHYRFKWVKPAQFSNGQAVTIEDVIATYESVLDSKTASPHRAALSHIQRIEKINETTMDIYLSKADSLFVSRLTLGVLPKSMNLIGSGDFKWVEKGLQKWTLERVSDARQFQFVLSKDPTVRVLKMMKGELDIIQNNLPFELVAYLDKKQAFEVKSRAGSNFSYLGFNLKDPILSDLRVRQAIAMGIDRQALIQYLFQDQARPAHSLLPETHWAGLKKFQPIKYKPKQAQRLLAEAGYNEQNPLVLSYKTSTDPFRIRLATVMQAQLAKIGVQLNIQSYDWGTFYGDIKNGNFQLYSLAWVGIKTPDIFQYVFHSEFQPPKGANRGAYVNPKVDQWIEQEDYLKVQQQVLEDLPYVPLWYENQVAIVGESAKKYRLSADGNYSGLNYVD